MQDKNSTALVVISAAVVGLLVGFIASSAMKNDADTTMGSMPTPAMKSAKVIPTTDTKAANLRVILNSLEREHVQLAAIATKSGFDGKADFEAAAKSLDQNSVDLSKAVGSIYGKDAEAKFLEIWRSHIGFFVDYTVAAKKGDKAGMDKAVSNLGGYVDAIADFFSGANPNLPRDAVKSLVSEHVTLLKSVVDAHGSADYAKSYTQQHATSEQVGVIADTLSGAIVKQYPEKF